MVTALPQAVVATFVPHVGILQRSTFLTFSASSKEVFEVFPTTTLSRQRPFSVSSDKDSKIIPRQCQSRYIYTVSHFSSFSSIFILPTIYNFQNAQYKQPPTALSATATMSVIQNEHQYPVDEKVTGDDVKRALLCIVM